MLVFLLVFIDRKAKTVNNTIFSLQCNRLLRWCPSPDCSSVIRVQHVESRPVTCRCGHTFCFACGNNWHEPVRCTLLRKWIKKCDDDSETSNWIAANTKVVGRCWLIVFYTSYSYLPVFRNEKECPKCKATIEKDGGCNHMVCKNSHCKTEFCWVCLGPWEPHGTSWYLFSKSFLSFSITLLL